jgi:Pvc16 N-terminal domain/IPT/TIG domain
VSNFLAVATVTEALKRMLDKAVSSDVNGAEAKAVKPNATTSLPARGVNVFLYQVLPNVGLRNHDLPTRREDGSVQQRPRVALNLHYLLSVYGDDGTLEPQRVLGSIVRTLHATPAVTHEYIEDAITHTADLSASDLADEVECVKLTPLSLSLEELSKLWSVFFQTSYALSVAYEASVIFIDSKKERARVALPVRERKLIAIPFERPVIEAVSPQIVQPGGVLTLQGYNLKGQVTKVVFGNVEASPSAFNSSELTVTLPASLQAGIHSVRVRHDVDLKTNQEPHRGYSSNIVAFALAPVITTPPPITAAIGAMLSLTVNPAVAREQEVVLLVGSETIVIPSRLKTDPPQSNTLQFPIPATFLTGNFLLRVQVDGVQSPLTVDENEASPTYEQYISPKVTLT